MGLRACAVALCCALAVARAAGYTVDCNTDYTDCDAELSKFDSNEENFSSASNPPEIMTASDASVPFLPTIPTISATTLPTTQHNLESIENTESKPTKYSQVEQTTANEAAMMKEPRLLNLNVDELQNFANALHNGTMKQNNNQKVDLSYVNMDDEEDVPGLIEHDKYDDKVIPDKFFTNKQVPFPGLTEFNNESSEQDICIHNGIAYKIGDRIHNGCEETCECQPGGSIECSPRCKHPYIRKGRRLSDPLCFETPVDECCSIIACSTGNHDVKSTKVEVCRHNNETHVVGERWHIGCDLTCSCEPNSVVSCKPRCKKLPPSDKCINVQDPNDMCCELQICDVSQDVHEEPGDNSTSSNSSTTTTTPATHVAATENLSIPKFLPTIPYILPTTEKPIQEVSEPIGSVKVLQNNTVQVNLMNDNSSENPIYLMISSDGGKTYNDIELMYSNLILNLPGGKDYILKSKESGTKFNFTITSTGEEGQNDTIIVKDGSIGCHHDGKFYSIGEEFHIGCTELCECTGHNTRECVELVCPSHVGLELISKGCVRWAPNPPAKPPNCCPRTARCLSDGTCHYKGVPIPNWTEVPISLTGCEQRCFCENGELDCQEICTALPPLPPQNLRCPPLHHPAPVNISDDDCCKRWGCVPNADVSTLNALIEDAYFHSNYMYLTPTPILPQILSTTPVPGFMPSLNDGKIYVPATSIPMLSKETKNTSVFNSEKSLFVNPLDWRRPIKPILETPAPGSEFSRLTPAQYPKYIGKSLPKGFKAAPVFLPSVNDVRKYILKASTFPNEAKNVIVFNSEELLSPVKHSPAALDWRSQVKPLIRTSPSQTVYKQNIPTQKTKYFVSNIVDDVVNHVQSPLFVPVGPQIAKKPELFTADYNYKKQISAVAPKYAKPLLSLDLFLPNNDNRGFMYLPNTKRIPTRYQAFSLKKNYENSKPNVCNLNSIYHIQPGDENDTKKFAHGWRPNYGVYVNQHSFSNPYERVMFKPKEKPTAKLSTLYESPFDVNHIKNQNHLEVRSVASGNIERSTKDTRKNNTADAEKTTEAGHSQSPPPLKPDQSQSAFLPTIRPEIHFPEEPEFDENIIHKPHGERDMPGLPAGFTVPPIFGEENKKLTVLSIQADSPTSVKLLFGLPPVLVGLRGSVDLRYTDKFDQEVSAWFSQVFAPADEVLTTPRLEFRLTGLKPSTTYKIKGKLYLHNLPVEPESQIYTIRTMDLPSVTPSDEGKSRDVDAKLALVDVNDTVAHVTWRHFTDDELQFIDGIQVRYRPVGTPIYSMTELLHYSRSVAELHDLRPGTHYEASLILVPPPHALTELHDPGRVEFTTAPFVDLYNWSITIHVQVVGSGAAQLSWHGVPSPAERWVRVYRAAHACGSTRHEHDTFRLAARDLPPTITLAGLEPNTRCRVWLELFLTNGKIKTSNVVEINTKPEDSPDPIDNDVLSSMVAGVRGSTSRGDYYGALVVVGVVAALGALTSLLLLLVLVRRHRPRSVPITPVPSAPRESSLPPYDNPAYKLELQQETMDL